MKKALSEKLNDERINPSVVICTVDKDLNMIPGWHYDFVKQNMFWVTEEEGMKFFYRQLLTGDGTDNIYGIKGLGKGTAAKIIPDECTRNAKEMYDLVKLNYEIKEMPFTRLLENAQLLWIRREENEMWSPPVGT